MDASQYRGGVATHAPMAASLLWPHLRPGIQNIPIGLAYHGSGGIWHGIGVPTSLALRKIPGEGTCALAEEGGGAGGKGG